jgi:hypothetical protein
MGIRFFIDLPNGETIMRRDTDRGVDYRGKKAGTFLYVEGTWIKANRKIDYKAFPSRHECDGRCMFAKGGNCECACGGKNHGKGGPKIKCEAA